MFDAVDELEEPNGRDADPPQIVADRSVLVPLEQRLDAAPDRRQRDARRVSQPEGILFDTISDRGRIQHRADRVKELLSRLRHTLEVVSLGNAQRRRFTFFQQQLTIAEDRVDRASQLVPNPRDEGVEFAHRLTTPA